VKCRNSGRATTHTDKELYKQFTEETGIKGESCWKPRRRIAGADSKNRGKNNSPGRLLVLVRCARLQRAQV